MRIVTNRAIKPILGAILLLRGVPFWQRSRGRRSSQVSSSLQDFSTSPGFSGCWLWKTSFFSRRDYRPLRGVSLLTICTSVS